MSAAVIYRSRAAAGDWRRPSLRAGGAAFPDQALFKVIGARHSLAGVRQLVAYVSREGAYATRYNLGRPLLLRDEAGEPWQRGAKSVIADLTERWGLPDGQALAYRRLRRDMAAPDKERREPALVWHVVVSIHRRAAPSGRPERARIDAGALREALGIAAPLSADEAEDYAPAGASRWTEAERRRILVPLEEAVRGFALEALGQAGWRALWTLHEDGAQPHAHLIVCGENVFGGRLRFDRYGETADEFREAFTRQARECGIDVAAERREDRDEVRRAVLDGAARIRPHVSAAEAKRGSRRLAEQAPAWYLAEGKAYERRRAADAQKRLIASLEAEPDHRQARYAEQLAPPSPRQASLPEELSGPDWTALLARIQTCFTDPATALRAYARLASENAHLGGTGKAVYPGKALADWYMRHQPIAFGEITQAALLLCRDKDLGALLKRCRPEAAYAPEAGDPVALAKAMRAAEAARAEVRILRERRIMAASLSRLAARSEALFGATPRAEAIRMIAAQLSRLPEGSAASARPRAQQGRRPPAALDGSVPERAGAAAAPRRGLLWRLLRRGSDERGPE